MASSIVLTTLSQVMQVFPEPALEIFEIEDSKIQGYILHESDIVRGLVNYDYAISQQNDIEMSFQSYGVDATGFIDFVWNPNADGHPDLRIEMFEGADYVFDWNTRTMLLTPSFCLKVVTLWNELTLPTTPVTNIIQIGKPIEFLVLGGTFDSQRKTGMPYDTNRFNDYAQQLFLNESAVDPFIQRLCALFVVLDIIKYWIKPLYQIDEDTDIVGVTFKDKDSLPGWDHMQKRLENAISEMLDAIGKWGIKNGRVGDGNGSSAEDPSLLRVTKVGTSVRGSSIVSERHGISPFMGWDSPFVFDRPITSAVGDVMFSGGGW